MEQDDEEVADLLKRAHALACQFKYTEALPPLQRAVELAPQSLEAWRQLGMLYGYLGRVEDLEQTFDQAFRLVTDPIDEVMLWFARGHAENNADAWERALRSFTQLAELEPDWGPPWLCCGMALGNMGAFVDPSYHAKALAALDHALALGLNATDERVAYSLKAKSLWGLGREEEAERCSQKVVALQRAEKTKRTEADPSHQAL